MIHPEKIMGSIPSSVKSRLLNSYKKWKKEFEGREYASSQAAAAAMLEVKPYDLGIFNKTLHYMGTLVAKEMMEPNPFCFSDAAKKAGVETYIRLFTATIGIPETPMLETYFRSNLIYHLACHGMAGKRVYQVSPGLAQSLKDTELRGLTSDDLHLPYPAVYIEVPKNADLKVWNQESGWHDLEGFYIVEDPKYHYTLRHNDPIERLDEPDLPTCRTWRFMLVGSKKGAIKIGDGEVEDDALSFFRLSLVPGQSLDDIIETLNSEMKLDNKNFNAFGEMAEYWTVPFRWAMNAILYATNVEKGREIIMNREAANLMKRIDKIKGRNNKKRKNLQNRLRGMDLRKRFLLGERIVVDRSEDEQRDESGVGNSLMVRVKVAGHWRRVAYGPQSSLRKWKWIQPYWKGPEDGVFSTKKHVLK